MDDPRKLVLWASEWHFAESSPNDGGVPLVAICGREVPFNASVKPYKPTKDVCANCRRSRPLWAMAA